MYNEEEMANMEAYFANKGLNNPDFAMKVSQMKPEEKMQLYQDYAGQEALAGEALSDATSLRDQPKAKGQGVGPDNLYVGDVAGRVADGIRGFKAGRDRKSAQSELKRLSDAKTSGTVLTANTYADIAKENNAREMKRRADATRKPITSIGGQTEEEKRRFIMGGR